VNKEKNKSAKLVQQHSNWTEFEGNRNIFV